MPAFLASLLLVERLLVNVLGSPALLLRTLADLDDARTEPVAAVLALLGLLVEVLAGDVLIVLALGSACILPGAMGRRTGRLVSLVTPVGVRRLLHLLVGGALLAQTTLAVPRAPRLATAGAARSSSRQRSRSSCGAMRATSAPCDAMAVAGGRAGTGRRAAHPRRSAAPPPLWLGAGCPPQHWATIHPSTRLRGCGGRHAVGHRGSSASAGGSVVRADPVVLAADLSCEPTGNRRRPL
jgi:hypothetical protein